MRLMRPRWPGRPLLRCPRLWGWAIWCLALGVACVHAGGGRRRPSAFNIVPDLFRFRQPFHSFPAGASDASGTAGRTSPGDGMEEGLSVVDAARRRSLRWGVLWRLYQTVLQQPRLGAAGAIAWTRRRHQRLEYTPPVDVRFSIPDLGPVAVASSSSPSCIHLVTRAASPEQKSLIYVNGTEVSGHLQPSVALPSALPLEEPPLRLREGDRTAESVGLNLVGEFSIAKPAYLHIAPRRAGETPLLWVTQFSLTRRGSVSGVNIFGRGPVESKLGFSFNWPNEVYNLPPGTILGASEEALVVADGFLMPGRSDGGIYVVQEPGRHNEKVVCLTQRRPGWFYHKAAWVDVMGTGRKSLLTARATKPFFGPTEGELVLLLQADSPFPLADWNTPWQELVLVKGPDVMFEVVDLDPDDDTIEVFAAEFFSRRLTLHRIRKGDWREGRLPRVVSSRVLDDSLGPAYSVVLADLVGRGRPSHVLVSSHECQYEGLDGADSAAAGSGTARRSGQGGEGGGSSSSSSSREGGAPPRAAESQGGAALKGGSLFAYEIPADWQEAGAWRRSTVATGFQVRTWGQINPGAPGFAYVFHPHAAMRAAGRRPYILLAGDCSHAAYIYRPVEGWEGDDVRYELFTEVNCGGTVGSLAVGHRPLFGEGGSEGEAGWAKIFIPNFDSDKVYVFSFAPERGLNCAPSLAPLSVPTVAAERLEEARRAREEEEAAALQGLQGYGRARADATKLS